MNDKAPRKPTNEEKEQLVQMPSRMLCSGGEQKSSEICRANLWSERKGNYQTDREASLVLARNSDMRAEKSSSREEKSLEKSQKDTCL